LDEINTIAEENGFQIRYEASDSDPQTNKIHTAFHEYLLKFNGDPKDFAALIQYSHRYEKPIPVSDWLHLLKNLSSRILHNQVFPTESSKGVAANDLEKVLKLGPALTNPKSTVSMRDDYAEIIFTLKNLLLLLQKGKWNLVYLIFPHTLMNEVLQSTTITDESRISLCKLSYYFLQELQRQRGNLNSKRTLKMNKVCFARPNTFIRTANTILAIGRALTFLSVDLL
jgi:hypothetical protein